MKTEFELKLGKGDQGAGHQLLIKVIDSKTTPTVAVYASGLTKCTQASGWLTDKDAVLLAKNILKAYKK